MFLEDLFEIRSFIRKNSFSDTKYVMYSSQNTYHMMRVHVSGEKLESLL